MGRIGRWAVAGALLLATGCGVRAGGPGAAATPNPLPAAECPAGFYCVWPDAGRQGPMTQLSGDHPRWPRQQASSVANSGDLDVVLYTGPRYTGYELRVPAGDHTDLPPAWNDGIRSSRWTDPDPS